MKDAPRQPRRSREQVTHDRAQAMRRAEAQVWHALAPLLPTDRVVLLDEALAG
jgi:hypothetical protein